AVWWHPIPLLPDWLVLHSTTGTAVIDTLLATIMTIGALAIARLGSGPAGVGWRPAAHGLARAAAAQAWRGGIPAASIPLLLIAYLARSRAMFEGVLVGVPGRSVVAGLVA